MLDLLSGTALQSSLPFRMHTIRLVGRRAFLLNAGAHLKRPIFHAIKPRGATSSEYTQNPAWKQNDESGRLKYS